MKTPDVKSEYSQRLKARQATAARCRRLERTVSFARLAVFLAGLVVAWLSLGKGSLGVGWLAVPILAFLVLVVQQERLVRGVRHADRAAAHYEEGMARIENRWPGRGVPGEQFADGRHAYSEDLDLFGPGSLFELLCTARTKSGEKMLAEWLRAPASPEQVRGRQEAVAELRGNLDLREALVLTGSEVRAALDPKMLAEWGERPSSLTSRPARVGAASLALSSLAALVAWPVLGWGPLPFLWFFVLGQVLTLTLSSRVGFVIGGVNRPGKDLDVLSHLLRKIEGGCFEARLLRELQSTLLTDGKPPSDSVKQLDRLIEWLDAQRNMLFAPLALALMWPVQMAFAIEAWRASTGPALRGWLAVAGEFEALCALATYSYEHPEDPFPEILEKEVRLEGEGLGHPLLPAAQVVRNDVRLGGEQKLIIVSGSNMSGKSTLLRTVGTNVVLALAGAPVRARRLRLSPLALGASIRVLDSLQGGSSRFYAEITRIRKIVDLARGEHPLLFLLDEILHGTNSHDRRIGAAAVVRTLVGKGAIGLVTTHDLALARIADDLESHAVNCHFEDHLEDGKMIFDYRLRAGVVQKSNALALMRSVGLEV